jgi:hypothetical protein
MKKIILSLIILVNVSLLSQDREPSIMKFTPDNKFLGVGLNNNTKQINFIINK